MRFYRGLQSFKIMSFDLDDTLYDNSDVIRLAEERFLQCVQEDVYKRQVWRLVNMLPVWAFRT